MDGLKMFGFIFALLAEIFVVGVAIDTHATLMYVVVTIQGINVIWQFLRVLEILP
jgi:hypothetical protein